MKKWFCLAIVLILCIISSIFIVDSQNFVKIGNVIDYSFDYQGNLYILDLDGDNVNLIKSDSVGNKVFSRTLPSESNGSYFKYKQIETDYSGDILILSELISDIEVERGKFQPTIESEYLSRYRPNGEFVDNIASADWSNHDEIITNSYMVRFVVFEDFIKLICRLDEYDFRLSQIPADYISEPKDVFDFKLINEKGNSSETNLADDFSITVTSNNDIVYASKSDQIYALKEGNIVERITSKISNEVSVIQLSSNYNTVCFLDYLSGGIYTYDTVSGEVSQVFKVDSCINKENDKYVYDIYDICFVSSDKQELFSGRTRDGQGFIRFGSVSSSISKIKEPINYKIIGGIAICTLLLFVPFVILYLVVRILRKRFPLKIKILLLFFPVLILSLTLVFRLVHDKAGYNYKCLKLETQNAISSTFAYMIDGNALENLSFNDYESNEYLSLKSEVDKIFNLYQEKNLNSSDFIKIYKVEDNSIYTFLRFDNNDNIYADLAFEDAIGTDNSVLLTRQNHSYGEADLYDILDKMQYKRQPNSIFSPGVEVYDRILSIDNNEFIGVVNPIYNSSGSIVGLVENVILGDKYFSELNDIYFDVVLFLIAEVIVLLVYFFFIIKFSLKPLNVLQKSVSLVGVGIWNAKVKIKSNDELGDIAVAFNMMSDRIDKYISNIVLLNKTSVRFLPKDIFSLMGKERLTDVHLYDKVEKRCNLIFLNFKYEGNAHDRSDKESHFNKMNDNFNSIYEIVVTNNGIVESYNENGILLIFPGSSDNALSAVIQLKDLFRNNKDSTSIKIVFGADDVLIGVAGNEERYSMNVISDTIMLGRYIDSHIDKAGVKYVIMQNIIGDLTDRPNLNYRYIGKVKMISNGGFENIYELIDDGEVHEKNLYLSTKNLFEYGVRSYVNGDFYDARKAFSSVLSVNEYDKVAMYYISLCSENENIEHYNWEGCIF